MPPRFECIQCKPHILVASAGVLRKNEGRTLELLQLLTLIIPDGLLFKSIEDFRKNNPHLNAWLEVDNRRQINWRLWHPYDEFRLFFENSTNIVMELLVAAGLIISNLYNNKFPEDYPTDLKLLSQSTESNNLNMNDYEGTLVT